MGEYSSLYEKIRKKNLGESTSNKTSSGSSGGTYSSAYEKIKNAHVMRAEVDPTITVDNNYINKFFDDYNRFVSSASESYKGIGYSSAGKLYDDYGQQGEDLRKRGETIQRYLWANRDAFGDEYASIADSIEQMMSGQRSIVDSYRIAANNMNLFDSEDSYNQYVQRQQDYQNKWGHYVDEADYAHYSSAGAAIKNPTVAEAERGITVFGKQIGGADVGNIVTYSRDNYQQIGMGEANKSSVVGKSLYHYMTDDEVGIYNYLLAKNGSEAAQAYLDDIEEELNFRMGSGQANALMGLENPIARGISLTGASLGSGVDQWGSGVKQLLSDEKLPTSAAQYGSSVIAENLDGVGRYAYLAGNTIGNMAPSILLSSLTAGLGASTAVAQGVGNFALGVSAAGNAYGQALAEGYGQGQARTYGMLVGASEALLQKMIGGISSLGGLSGKLAGKVAVIDNALLRISAQFGLSIGSEILEEEIQSFLEPSFRAYLFGEEYDAPTFEEMLETAIVTALSTGLLEGPSSIGGDIANSRYYKKIYGESQQDLVNEGLEFDEGTLSRSLAEKYQEVLNGNGSLNGHQLGRMVEANEQQFMADDMASMEKAVAQRLTELGETGDVAALSKVIAKQAAGDKLTRAERASVETSKYGQRVANEMNPSNVESGEYASGWARNIGTSKVNYEAYNADLLALADEVAAAPGRLDFKSAMPATERFTASGEGKTNIADMGKVKIASTEGGKMTLKTESGQTVKAEDVSFRSEDEAMVYSAVLDMGVSPVVAQSIVDNFDGTNGRAYAVDVKLAYQYGKMNFPKSYLEKLTIKPHQAEHAYNLGRSDAKAEVMAPKTKRVVKGKRGTVTFETAVDETTLTSVQRESLNGIKAIANMSNLNVHVFMSDKENGYRYTMPDGAVRSANGWYIPGTNEIWIDLNAGNAGEGTMLYTAGHEISHYIKEWSPAKWRVMADFLIEQYGEKGVPVDALLERQMAKIRRRDPSLKGNALMDAAYEELVADAMSEMLVDGEVAQKMAELKKKDKTLWEKIKEAIHDLLERWGLIREEYEGRTPDASEAQFLRGMDKAFKQLQALYTEAFAEADANFAAAEEIGVDIDAKTDSVSPAVVMSERTWTESEYVQQRDAAAAEIAKAIGVSVAKAKAYIDDVNSIAKMIAEDRVRLDYFSSPGRSSFVGNVEYGGSFDFSTLCKKRRLLTGTFTAIQKALPNTALTADEILDIRNRMKAKGLEVSCGLCYVEGSRANMGQFAKEFLRLYKQYYPDAWQPNMADVNTPDGIEWVRINHPECYEQYEYFWNHYGMLKEGDKALFASQQKPKLYQLHTEYKGEVLDKFKDDGNVEAKNLNGGIRLQSFSDFEIVHLIDVMQIVMDMSRVGLAGQAYTKVPDFAWALGDTGLKINLSLIAKGVDADGKLIFDDVEGMPIAEAMKLRDRYSKNVGTILVAFNDQQLMAAMADDRVDYIIPFHRSQWKKSQYEAMGLPAKTKDYTYMQNEKYIKPQYHEYRGRMVKDKASNYMPNEYWDFSKSGKENAEAYLEMCAKNNKRPKFYKLLQNNGDGSYSLKADGSTDGYWKLLIDFKMYDNDGVGSPQLPVTPVFNMEQARRMLDTYQGGHANFPVAQGIVDEFVEEYKAKHKDVKYSDRVTDADTLAFLDGQIERGEYITTYKSMRLDGYDANGNPILHSPMAAEIKGKFENEYELGVWYQATEHPELIKFDKKNGLPYFELDKGVDEFGNELGKVPARYNPYEHSSNYVINDQFKTAFKRPNLVVVEMRIPLSEATSGYQAQYAKDPVGWSEWKKGDVASALAKKGKERMVFLSRWSMPVRILSDAEVAKQYKELLSGTGVKVPNNVVTPTLLKALEEAGVDIDSEGISRFEAAYAEQAAKREAKKAAESKALKGAKRGATMGTVKNSLREDLENGKARKEDRGAFLRRATGEGLRIFEGDAIAYGYRAVPWESAGKNARQIQKELKALGIDSEIFDGDVLWNLNGVSGERVSPQSVTVEKKLILVNANASAAPRNTAGHEAFHLWGHTDARAIYVDEVEYNLNYSSEDFVAYQSTIANAYFGSDVDLSDVAKLQKLREELFAYISGDIHEGVNDDLLQPMFHDYDAVKAAWSVLCKENGGNQVKLSERDTDSVSNRDLLVGAFESVAKDDTERRKIEEYRQNVEQLNEQEKKLAEIRRQLHELRFSKGPRDKEQVRKLRDEATKTANRISNYDKILLRLEASKPLMAVLDREKAKVYNMASQKWADRMEKARTGRDSTEMRRKIKAFKGKLEKSLLNPTDRVYVPVDLVNAMVDVCSLIDIDTDLYHADGSVNKAQERRNLTKEKLQNLKDEYEKLKTHSDPIYQGEFDELVYTYLGELRDKFSGKPLREMSLDELTELYETLRAIDETLRDARKLIGWGDAESVYEAGDAIVAEQNAITKSRKGGQRNAAQKARDASLNMSLSPVRNVERMSGYHDDSYLLRLFKKFEQGVRKKNKFVMEAYKSFEHLTSGKAYEDAMYTEVGGKKYEDINGRKFGISKMQMMQAILSFERESANHMNHIQSGGFTFADLDMLRKGKLRDAISEEHSHRVPNAVDLVAEFTKVLENDQWCQDYMAAARKFFNGTAKDAINETSIALKHRIIAKDKSYIPFEVDKNFVVREISAENDIQQTINSYGMLKSIKDGAPQPLIITGLNNILDRHIDQVGNVYGLAIEVRNFNKVWNVRAMDAVGSDPTVKAAIQRNWGGEGVKHIEQAVQDIQGPRHNEQSAIYKKVKSGYIGATFLLNLSVVTKQIGSLYSSTSMLKWRGPVRQLGNLLYTMANHKAISAEVDKYTATAWMRRQGLSDAEVHTFMTEGKKTLVGKLVSKLPTAANPTKWITGMDHAVALSLWRYAKQDTAKRTGLTGEELLKATAEFYDEVVENTQSMTDMLHRPEIQKRSDILSESFAMFKTDLYQMAGQLHVTAGRYAANKTKENGKALGRTVYAIAMSAMWAQLMTTVFALLRYKVNPYRDDEDEELTAESWLKRQGFALAGDLMGYIMPIFGSETVGFFENIMYGESDDIVDSVALTAINDLYDTMTTVANAIKDGEMPEPAQMKKLVVKSLQVFGVPASNIIRTYEAIQLHAKDIANGEFFSFEAGVDRSAGHHIHRIVEAMIEGKTDVALGLYEEALEETAMGDGDLSEAKSSLKTALGNKFKDGEITESQTIDVLVKCFDYERDEAEQIVGQWNFKKEYGVAWSDRGDAYKSGTISARELKTLLMDVGGKTAEEAEMQIKVYDWQREGFDVDVSQTSVIKDYEEFCQPAGISKKVYFDAYEFYKDAGEANVAYSKTIECMPYINSLPLTAAQKTALALCWWAESTVRKYKVW